METLNIRSSSRERQSGGFLASVLTNDAFLCHRQWRCKQQTQTKLLNYIVRVQLRQEIISFLTFSHRTFIESIAHLYLRWENVETEVITEINTNEI